MSSKRLRAAATPPLMHPLSRDALMVVFSFVSIRDLLRLRTVGSAFQALVLEQLRQRDTLYIDTEWSRAFISDVRTGMALQALVAVLTPRRIRTLCVIRCNGAVAPRVETLFRLFPNITLAEVEYQGSIPVTSNTFLRVALKSPMIRELVISGPNSNIAANKDLEDLLRTSSAPLTCLRHYVTRDSPTDAKWNRLSLWNGLARLRCISLDVLYGDRNFLSALKKCVALRSLDLAMLLPTNSVSILGYTTEMATALAASNCPLNDIQLWCHGTKIDQDAWRAPAHETTTTADMLRAWAAIGTLTGIDIKMPTEAWAGDDRGRASAMADVFSRLPDLTIFNMKPTIEVDTRFLELTMESHRDMRHNIVLGTMDEPIDAAVASRWFARHPKTHNAFSKFTKVIVSADVDWTVFPRLSGDNCLTVAGPTRLSALARLPYLRHSPLQIQGRELFVDDAAFAGLECEGLEITLVGDLSRVTAEFFQHVIRSRMSRLVLVPWTLDDVFGPRWPVANDTVEEQGTPRDLAADVARALSSGDKPCVYSWTLSNVTKLHVVV